jgi:hypothetical protein
MYANLLKEIIDDEGKVVFRDSFSLTMETTPEEVIEMYKKQGYTVEYSTTRIYK